MKSFFSKIVIITGLVALMGYAGVVSAAALPVEGWAFSIMPTGTSENNQNYNPGRPDRNVGQGGGWISMSSQNHPGLSFSYGVTVDDTTGNFSGEAWNTYLGYVNFSNARIANPTCLRDGTGTSAVLGTITFLSASQPQAGGWDGIVDMTGNWTQPVMVDCSTGTLSGYGWGDYVVGWVDFKWVKITQVDVCPDNNDYSETLGNQTTVPNGFQKVNGQCVPDDETTCPVDEPYRYDGACYERRCIAKDGSNDFMYFNNDDPVPQICQDPPPPRPCEDPALCPVSPGPIYKEN